MKILHRFSLPITLTLCFSFMPNQGVATIGLAEWEVYTPGGNVISHSDAWQDLCGDGDCLRADTSDLNSERLVFVTDLKRWRFYNGYVIGETKNEYFIFHEASKEIKKYRTEKQFFDALEEAKLGEPKSSWLTKDDAWEEAWFPFIIWAPCQNILKAGNQDINASQTAGFNYPGLSQEICQQKLSSVRLAQYKERTWGRQCRQVNFNQLSSEGSERTFQEFCIQIMRQN